MTRRLCARAGAVCVAVGLTAGLSTVPAAADDAPPALPSTSNGCVGPSPVRDSGRMSWPVARMAPYQTWPLSRGSGVVVAILDSGVSGGAAGLGGAVAAGPDVVTGGSGQSDCLGRGTALAAIVAARPVAGTGVVGMAPEATVLPVRIIDAQRKVTTKAIVDGINAAVDAGADVVLLGTGDVTDSAALRGAVARATGRDVLVVAPVNDGSSAFAGQPPPVWYPAAYPEVLAVGGVGADGQATTLSGKGSEPDVLAPGVNAVVPGPSGDGQYTVGGSAIAAAYAAGAAALVRAYQPELRAAEVAQRLVVTAERPPHAVAGTVDAYAAVSTLEPGQAARTVRLDAAPVSVATAPPADPAAARARLVSAAVAFVALLVAVLLWVRRARRG
ncbi:S8 family serine peptidase [Dactylosporangium sp. NPDC005555]|uniref:S8 family serine peptidase n=1 Tax=Dactylosporangium sp. NPDC005555 TaxID=3154889 RepID=UPI0033AAB1D8